MAHSKCLVVYKVIVTRCSASPNIRSGLQIIFGLILLEKQQFSIKIAFTICESEHAVRAGRGRTALTGCCDGLSKKNDKVDF